MAYKVLIVEDHPIIIQGYQLGFDQLMEERPELEFQIEQGHTLDQAMHLLQKEKSAPFDIAFLDISVPESQDSKILSGEDLGIYLRKHHPATKIIIATTFNDNYRVYNILKNVDPDAFLVKNDLTAGEIEKALVAVIEGSPYYSKSILSIMRQTMAQDFVLDEYDRKILYHLSLGALTKELPEFIHLSLPAIEKRKKKLKEVFNLDSSSDKELLEAAKEKGFI